MYNQIKRKKKKRAGSRDTRIKGVSWKLEPQRQGGSMDKQREVQVEDNMEGLGSNRSAGWYKT